MIQENLPVQSFAIWVKVSDDDFDANGETDIWIEPRTLFEMDSARGVIVTKASFDREYRDSYTIKVKSCDRGKPKICSFKEILVKIGDENDNMPTMDQRIINANVREDLQINSRILKVFASDSDLSPGFGELNFRLETENKNFEIRRDSGELFLVEKLDFEVRQDYEVTNRT